MTLLIVAFIITGIMFLIGYIMEHTEPMMFTERRRERESHMAIESAYNDALRKMNEEAGQGWKNWQYQ